MAGTVHFIKGDDQVLVSQMLGELLDDLIGAGDRSLMLEEVTEDAMLSGDEPDLTALVTAAQTPPFLTDRRVVVGRHLAPFTRAPLVAPLVDYLSDPSPETDLVLVWEKPLVSGRKTGSVPKSLREAVAAAGGTITEAGSGRGNKALIDQRLNQAAVLIEPAARALIIDNVGDDAGSVAPLIDLLVSAFGPGATVGVADVSPFLGQASDVPPWELTDAIDSGDIAGSLAKLERMLSGGGRHPLQIMATLHNHYERALALDGSGVGDERAAADVLGMKGSTFPAKKALGLARRLGSGRIFRCIDLLGQADLDLRGDSGLPADTIIEVLIARLANTSRA